ncbi:hypoxia up-regulated protein 1-like [Sycon ciliatum]|uniref:hypoxia up-regulated protein 1-like n=1 Tax=Sycon ciliatum TaxID=27933 RepID=UPI0031F6892F
MARGSIAALAVLVLTVASVSHVDSAAVMAVDFGSEFIKVAIVKPGVPMEIALNKESRRKTPNIVSMRDGERLFGDPAMNTGIRFPKFAFRYLLHILGQKFDSAAVRQFSERFPHYKLAENAERGTACIEYSDTETYCVEELVAMMLNNSRETASTYAEHPIKDAVIAVPPFFTQAQRNAMMYAAELVGLKVLQLLNSNTGVALNYGVFRRQTFNDTEQNLMFFDMGATSTVATIVSYQTVKIKELGFTETVPQLTVRSVGFDRTLGGLEMDLRLRDHLATVFDSQKKTSESVRTSPRAMAKLLKEANRVKQVLSANTDHMAQIEGLLPDIDFRAKVSREEFEKMCEDVFARVQAPVEQALKAAEMDASDLEQVIIVGGGSRVPKVQQLLMEVAKKTELGKSVNSDEAAALGASYSAAGLSKAFRIKKFGVKDISFFPMEVAFDRQTDEGNVKHVRRVLYNRHNVMPQKKIMTFNKFSDDFEFTLDYSDLSHLSKQQVVEHGPLNITHVSVSGVGDIFAKHNADNIEPKGVKAHFNLDTGGVLTLDHIEALFEKAPQPENDTDEASAFSDIVGGISSFFSGSEKEEGKQTEDKAQPEKDGEKEKTDEIKGEETKKESSDAPKSETNETVNATSSANSTAANSTASNATEAKKKPPQPVMIKELLNFTVTRKDFVPFSNETVTATKARLQEMADRDLEKVLLEASKNALEAYIFDMQDKMYSEEYTEASEEEERANVTTALSAASDWLYEEGEDATRKIYDEKLADLKKTARPIVRRVKEHVNRPLLVRQLRSSINSSRYFIVPALNFTKPMPGYVDSLYTKVEVDALITLTNETEAWLNETEAKQNETKKSEDPVLLSSDLKDKTNNLDREMYYLGNKAKYFVPTKKKVNATSKAAKAKNATVNGTTSDDANSTSEEPPTTEATPEDSEEFEFVPPTVEPTEAPKKRAKRKSEKPADAQEETLALPDGDEPTDEHQEL